MEVGFFRDFFLREVGELLLAQTPHILREVRKKSCKLLLVCLLSAQGLRTLATGCANIYSLSTPIPSTGELLSATVGNDETGETG